MYSGHKVGFRSTQTIGIMWTQREKEEEKIHFVAMAINQIASNQNIAPLKAISWEIYDTTVKVRSCKLLTRT